MHREFIGPAGFFNFADDFINFPFDRSAWTILMVFVVFGLIMMKVIAGERRCDTSVTSNILFKENAFKCYIITVLVVLVGLISGHVDPRLIYSHMGKLTAASSALAFVIAGFSTCKSKFLAHLNRRVTNVKEIGSIDTFLTIPRDFFWGMELYPNVLGFDIKQYITVHFSLTGTQLLIIGCAAKQYADLGYISSSMALAVLLQSVFIFASLRAKCKRESWKDKITQKSEQKPNIGFVVIWEHMVWIPVVNSLQTFFLVSHPLLLDKITFSILLCGGLLASLLHYNCVFHKYNLWNSWHTRLTMLTAAFFWCVPTLFAGETFWIFSWLLSWGRTSLLQ